MGGYGHAEGKLLLVDDSQLIILKGRRPVVVPRAQIGRIVELRRDPVWEGVIFGLLYAVVICLWSDGWADKETAMNYFGGMGLGATHGVSSAQAIADTVAVHLLTIFNRTYIKQQIYYRARAGT